MNIALPPRSLRQPIMVASGSLLLGCLACGGLLAVEQARQADFERSTRQQREIARSLQDSQNDVVRLRPVAEQMARLRLDPTREARTGWSASPASAQEPTVDGLNATKWQNQSLWPHSVAFLNAVDPAGDQRPGLRVIERCQLQRSAGSPDSVQADCEWVEYTLPASISP